MVTWTHLDLTFMLRLLFFCLHPTENAPMKLMLPLKQSVATVVHWGWGGEWRGGSEGRIVATLVVVPFVSRSMTSYVMAERVYSSWQWELVHMPCSVPHKERAAYEPLYGIYTSERFSEVTCRLAVRTARPVCCYPVTQTHGLMQQVNNCCI